MIITFDSNTWRKVASPHKFPKDPIIGDYLTINTAIKEGRINPFLSETIFTLEGIKRGDRKKLFKNYKAILGQKIQQRPDGSIAISFTIGPDINAHPGNNDFLTEHLSDAMKLGFNIVRLPRLAGITNPDIEPYIYDSQQENPAFDYDNLFKIAEYICSLEAGEYEITQIGSKYDQQGWFTGVGLAPDTENIAIAKAVAEWADGDSVALHIAMGGDYFCTNDMAKKAGNKSVLSADNVRKLNRRYSFRTITPTELANLIN